MRKCLLFWFAPLLMVAPASADDEIDLVFKNHLQNDLVDLGKLCLQGFQLFPGCGLRCSQAFQCLALLVQGGYWRSVFHTRDRR